MSISADNIQESIIAIRRRLWRLLLKAFGLVVLLLTLLTLGSTLVYLSTETRYNLFYEAPLAFLLKTYYQAHGSWVDVNSLFQGQGSLDLPYLKNEWQRSVLVDQDGMVVVDRGMVDSPIVGSMYLNQNEKRIILLTIESVPVGTLVMENAFIGAPLRLGLQVLAPILPISFILGLLTLVIGLLLMRRVVDPLSEVIAAAACVSNGDLSTRVSLHRRHDDLYALSSSFNQMASSLERSDLERRAMLADVAHELRTPLTVLRGRLEGIVDGVYPVDEAHIAPALEEVYLLERLVDDLRLLTLAEARQLPLDIREFDLAALAEKSAATFCAEAEEHAIQLSTEVLPLEQGIRSLTMVVADPQRVEQVIGNMVGNALRYVQNSGKVTIKVTQFTHTVRLAVSDNGPGLPETDLPFVFDRFWRGEKARNRSAGGAGLGLSIARQLVAVMGGEVGAQNLVGGGFEIWFDLPSAT